MPRCSDITPPGEKCGFSSSSLKWDRFSWKYICTSHSTCKSIWGHLLWWPMMTTVLVLPNLVQSLPRCWLSSTGNMLSEAIVREPPNTIWLLIGPNYRMLFVYRTVWYWNNIVRFFLSAWSPSISSWGNREAYPSAVYFHANAGVSIDVLIKLKKNEMRNGWKAHEHIWPVNACVTHLCSYLWRFNRCITCD